MGPFSFPVFKSSKKNYRFSCSVGDFSKLGKFSFICWFRRVKNHMDGNVQHEIIRTCLCGPAHTQQKQRASLLWQSFGAFNETAHSLERSNWHSLLILSSSEFVSSRRLLLVFRFLSLTKSPLFPRFSTGVHHVLSPSAFVFKNPPPRWRMQ